MDKDFSSFRKATFGGFNRKDVINYIEKMKNESFEYKKQVEQTVKSLNEKIRELEAAGLIMQQNIAEEASEQESAGIDCADIGQATKHLKVVADELCKSLGDFMDKLSEKGLIDGSAEAEKAEPSAESKQEEVFSFVDDILASISYLGSSEASAVSFVAKPEIKQSASVSDILSGYSFVN